VRTSLGNRRSVRRTHLVRRGQAGPRLRGCAHAAKVVAVARTPNSSAACNPQRVFNVYHHLADGTLPPDLWDDSAELAAMVYLAVHYPPQAALARLEKAIREYNRINRLLGLPELPFDAKQSKGRLTIVLCYISSSPGSMHVGTIYRSLLMDAHSNFDRRAGAVILQSDGESESDQAVRSAA